MDFAGVNVDFRNPKANPSAKALAGFGYARFVYNVSAGTGSLDFDAAHRLYGPHIDDLRAHGITPIGIFNHQTFGESRGYDWKAMSAWHWEQLSNDFVAAVIQIVRRYAGKGLVYQIWNEQDSASVAAVAVPPDVYGALFRRVYLAIKASDSTARVIIGGLVSGPGDGINYYKATKIQLHDGIGVHMYGVGAGGLFNTWGTIDEQLQPWLKLKRAIWLTEFGVTGKDGPPNEPVEKVARYARAFTAACADKVAVLCYFPWGEQHNGFPIETGGKVRRELIEALTGRAGNPPDPEPPIGPRPEYMTVAGLRAPLNVRLEPSTMFPVLAVIRNGDQIYPLMDIAGSGSDRWRMVELSNGITGWVHTTAAGKLSTIL